MDFRDYILQLGDKVIKLKEQILTEEATKNAFVMPFIMALGYDVFNPCEIIPEFTCDIGIKKGEKIDYAIINDGRPIILIECKHWNQNLDVHDGQLLRYFNVSNAKFGLLTNGIEYRFYSDLESPNKMDEKPFFEIDITDIKDVQIEELKKFHKSFFDINKIMDSASDLKYTNELKNIFIKELNSPSEQLIKLFARRVYNGVITSRVLEMFSALVKKSLNQVISDRIQERLSDALNKEKIAREEQSETEENDDTCALSGIITTEEELRAFYLIQSILVPMYDASRISYKDAKSHFSVILDKSIKKPVCKLMLGDKKRVLVLFDIDKKGERIEIECIEDIYKYRDRIVATVQSYA